MLWSAYPAALVGNPLGDPLCQDEPDDKSNDVGEEAADAALNNGDRDSIAETQQRYNPAPRNAPVTK